VAALRTFVFPGRSIKAPPVDALSLGSRVAVKTLQRDDAGDLTDLVAGFCIPTRHSCADRKQRTRLRRRRRTLHRRALSLGGKTSLGIDCSGLVQIALTASGVACPRDSDMQEQALGAPLPTGDLAGCAGAT